MLYIYKALCAVQNAKETWYLGPIKQVPLEKETESSYRNTEF
jgi:hypothetical protein